ncbi:MAG: ligase-associated DNA damage response exonuclease [Tepidisphaera sp.]|nr:ligase-associated DNA damage response exonuclease [Tepidisphaera sp.]
MNDGVGLACVPGGFHIDPWGAAKVAVITHAHSDHARAGSREYLCAGACEPFLRLRLPPGTTIRSAPWGERVPLGEAIVSFHPAGHIRGSAQVRVEHAGQVWVASGDYKRDADPTAEPFEPVACDTFITEATFALPIYKWDDPREVARELAAWWRGNREQRRPSVLFTYSLGKAQRVLGELWSLSCDASWAWMRDQPVRLHGAAVPLTDAYRAQGVPMLDTSPVSERDEPVPADNLAEGEKAARRANRSDPGQFARALVIAPPSAAGSPWMRRFGDDAATAFASGWMRVRGVRRRQGYDRGFVLSDHADWPGLLHTIRETGCRRVLATHGYAAPLARFLCEKGLDAAPLSSAFASTPEEDD